MTKNELNRDIKRLWKRYKSEKVESFEDLKQEFSRLYGADPQFKYLNKNTVLIMYSLNRIFRLKPFHLFGCDSDETIK